MENPSIQHGELLYQQGRFDLAGDALRQALVQEPQHPFAHALLALCLLHQQKYDEATEEARGAIFHAPDFAFGHYALGAVFLERNHFAEAEAEAQEALRLSPEQPDYCALLAQTYLARRRWQEALDAANRGLEHHPEHTGCVNLRAMALMNLGQAEAASATVAGALERNPQSALSHASQGWSLLHQNKPREALEHFREALRIDPNNQYARNGTMEALKARHLIYRLMLRYYLWMSRMSRGSQWGIVIGLWLGVQVLVTVKNRYPGLTVVILPLLIGYVAFVFASWLVDPIFTLTLLFSRFGRFLPTGMQKVGAILVGLLLLAGVGLLTLWLRYSSDLALVLMLLCLALTVPTTATFKSRPGKEALFMGLYTLGMAAAGVIGIGMMILGREEGVNLFQVALWGSVLCSFVSNFLRGLVIRK